MKRSPAIRLLFTCMIPAMVFLAACKKTATVAESTVPTVRSYPVVSDVTANSAQSYAEIVSNGGANIQSKGICWSATNNSPTTADLKATSTDDVVFGATANSLTPNTTYYLRAYATNSVGTGYSNVITFKTNTTTFAITATITTYSGKGIAGFVNGSASLTQFNGPANVATDAYSGVYVSDSFNNVIRKLTSSGTSSTFSGSGVTGYVEGLPTVASFNTPSKLVLDSYGNIFVSDAGNSVIRKITPNGVVSTFAGSGTANFMDGTGIAAAFKQPSGMAIDASGNIYLADQGNKRIRKINAAGVVGTLAGNSSAGQIEGTGTAASFDSPKALAVDATGNVYVVDQGNYAIRKITPFGEVSTLIGHKLLKNLLGNPTGICIDKERNLWITDANGRIIEITSGNILRVVADAASMSTGLSSVSLNNPTDIAVDKSGNFYIADYGNNLIRKMMVAVQQ